MSRILRVVIEADDHDPERIARALTALGLPPAAIHLSRVAATPALHRLGVSCDLPDGRLSIRGEAETPLPTDLDRLVP